MSKEIMDYNDMIVCLDCNNLDEGDYPWNFFEYNDHTFLHSCAECKSENIQFIELVRKESEGWIEQNHKLQKDLEEIEVSRGYTSSQIHTVKAPNDRTAIKMALEDEGYRTTYYGMDESVEVV